MTQIHVDHPRCAFCLDAVRTTDTKTPCRSCMAWSHSECLEEHGACPACGVEATVLYQPVCDKTGCENPADPRRREFGVTARYCTDHWLEWTDRQVGFARVVGLVTAVIVVLILVGSVNDGDFWNMALTALICSPLFPMPWLWARRNRQRVRATAESQVTEQRERAPGRERKLAISKPLKA